MRPLRLAIQLSTDCGCVIGGLYNQTAVNRLQINDDLPSADVHGVARNEYSRPVAEAEIFPKNIRSKHD